MFKALIFALGVTCAQANNHLVEFDIADTKQLEGVLRWQPFYDKYVDSLYAGNDNRPAQFDDEHHLCYWRWTVEQPFTIDSRYSIAVVHNCPPEVISSIDFNLSVTSGQGYIIVDDSTDRTQIDNGVRSINVAAKTAAGQGVNNDFGYWNDFDTEPVFTFTYQVNYAAGQTGTDGGVEAPATGGMYIPFPGEEDNGEDNEIFMIQRMGDPFVFYDNSLETSDIIGYLDETTQEHSTNLINPKISKDLAESTIVTGSYQVPDEFFKEGPVQISQIRAQGLRTPAAGCRDFTFSNGKSTVRTGWLGVNCRLNEKSQWTWINILLEDGIQLGNGRYKFYEAIRDLYTEVYHEFGDDHMYSYLGGVEYIQDDSDPFLIGSTSSDDGPVFESEIVINKNFCGIDYSILTFRMWPYDTELTTIVNWRPFECAIIMN